MLLCTQKTQKLSTSKEDPEGAVRTDSEKWLETRGGALPEAGASWSHTETHAANAGGRVVALTAGVSSPRPLPPPSPSAWRRQGLLVPGPSVRLWCAVLQLRSAATARRGSMDGSATPGSLFPPPLLFWFRTRVWGSARSRRQSSLTHKTTIPRFCRIFQ